MLVELLVAPPLLVAAKDAVCLDHLDHLVLLVATENLADLVHLELLVLLAKPQSPHAK